MRLMPDKINLGKSYSTPMLGPMSNYANWIEAGCPTDPLGRRMVMGYVLPEWQRPLVWDQERKVRFIESAWLGLNLGTFTYNSVNTGGFNKYDNLLIDGQQRMWSLQCYLECEFPVFGYRYSEITDVDKRMFGMSRIFASYVTETTDEKYLREYYDLMNFGGVAHTEDQRAT